MVRLERLRAVQETIKLSPSSNDGPHPSNQSQEDVPAHRPSVAHGPSSLPNAQVSFDKHFAVGTGSQFYGSSSVFALAVEVMAHAHDKFPDLTFESNIDYSLSNKSNDSPEITSSPPGRVNIKDLINLYMKSTNVLYDFVNEADLPEDIEVYLAACEKSGSQISSKEAHQFFRISIMCAAASANLSRYHPTYFAESLRFFHEASRLVEEVTSAVSADSLQALLLLCVFCLFHPKKGDIWKLLDYACRLSVELGYHTEQSGRIEDDLQKRRRRGVFWGLYTIERIVGQMFGRPSDLPEDIITTEYPWSINGARLADHASLQVISIAHQYRLVYLRSEIYRELYAPAEPPDLPLEWYRARFLTLLHWRQELQVEDGLTGVGSFTADLGYHSTISFLFQPLMLKALSNTRVSSYTNGSFDKIPSDNYWSSCEIVRLYYKVLRAPEGSQLGAFPMTIISAHYIFVAAMTILAHSLLALDGRVPTIGPMTENSFESRVINFGNIFEISSSSVVVLAWCAERWPGMAGILDTYRKLSERLLPALTRCGFVG